MINPKLKNFIAKLEKRIGERPSYRQVADALNINVAYVHNYLRRGHEPTSPAIRKALFLPKTNRAKPRHTEPTPAYLNWWRHLSKEKRHIIIQSEYYFFHEKENKP